MKYKCNSCGAKVDIGTWKKSLLINPNARVAGIYKCGSCGSSDLIPIVSLASRIREAKISFFIPILFFIGLLLALAYPKIVSILALSPEKSLRPSYWYTFFTYSFIYVDIFHFLFISLSIVFSGLIIEKYLSHYIMVTIIVVSMILGGIIYCLITPMSIPYIGGGMISYGYIGALLGCWTKYRKNFTLIMKIYTSIILLYLIKALIVISVMSSAEFAPLVVSFVGILLHFNFGKINVSEKIEKIEKKSITERKEGSKESSDISNQRQKFKRKRNIGCGVLLILAALYALSNFLKGGPSGNFPFLLGGLLAFAVMIYFGIRMIKGKEIKD